MTNPFLFFFPVLFLRCKPTHYLFNLLAGMPFFVFIFDFFCFSVSRFTIRKDVQLPVELQRSMAAEAEAGRNAKAKVSAQLCERVAFITLLEHSALITEHYLITKSVICYKLFLAVKCDYVSATSLMTDCRLRPLFLAA